MKVWDLEILDSSGHSLTPCAWGVVYVMSENTMKLSVNMKRLLLLNNIRMVQQDFRPSTLLQTISTNVVSYKYRWNDVGIVWVFYRLPRQ